MTIVVEARTVTTRREQGKCTTQGSGNKRNFFPLQGAEGEKSFLDITAFNEQRSFVRTYTSRAGEVVELGQGER